MSVLFQDTADRLAQAEIRMREINDILHAYGSKFNTTNIIRETDHENKIISWRWASRTVIPKQIPLLLSETIHHLRAALDNLAWQTVSHYSDFKNLSELQQKQIYFPICENQEKFSEGVKKKLPGIPKKFLEVFLQVQPFMGAGVIGYHPLTILRELSDKDKHRTLHVIATGAKVLSLGAQVEDDSYVTFHKSGKSPVEMLEGPLVDGATFAKLVLPSSFTGMDALQVEFMVGFVFANLLDNQRLVIPTLFMMYKYIMEEFFQKRFQIL